MWLRPADNGLVPRVSGSKLQPPILIKPPCIPRVRSQANRLFSLRCRVRVPLCRCTHELESSFFPRKKRGSGMRNFVLPWPDLHAAGTRVDARDREELCRIGSYRNGAHSVRVIGLETTDWALEGLGMPSAVRTSPSTGMAAAPAGAPVGTARSPPRPTHGSQCAASHDRRDGWGVRTFGVTSC